MYVLFYFFTVKIGVQVRKFSQCVMSCLRLDFPRFSCHSLARSYIVRLGNATSSIFLQTRHQLYSLSFIFKFIVMFPFLPLLGAAIVGQYSDFAMGFRRHFRGRRKVFCLLQSIRPSLGPTKPSTSVFSQPPCSGINYTYTPYSTVQSPS